MPEDDSMTVTPPYATHAGNLKNNENHKTTL